MAGTPDRYCGNCGNELDPEDQFCQNCGRPVHRTAQLPTPETDVPVPPPPPSPQVWETTSSPSGQASALSQGRLTSFRLLVGFAIVIVLLLLLGAVVVALRVASGGSQFSVSSFGAPQSADEVLQELKDRDLPIGKSVAYTAKNDPNDLLGRPNQYTSKVMFEDTRLNPDPIADKFDVQNGGSIEVLENKNDAIRRNEYVDSIGKGFSPISEYTYREGTVLLRLSQRLLPKQAAAYENALKDIM
jgi:hypothetical protein